MFERFTKSARDVVLHARLQSQELRHDHVGTEHLLLALLAPGAGVSHAVLTEAGLDARGVRADIERLIGSRATLLTAEDAAALHTIGIDLDAVLARIEESFGPDALTPPPPARRRGLFGRKARSGGFTPRAKKVLELSLREALRLKHNYIGTEHILLGMLREGEGMAAKILTEAGLSLTALRDATTTAIRKAA